MTIRLNDLNDDCLRVIIRFLTFRDQILCHQVSQRFQYLVECEWNYKCAVQKIFLSEFFWKASKIEAYFPNFIRSISYVVEDLELNTYHLKRWGLLLRGLGFPNIKSITVHLAQTNANTDDQMLLITQSFPNLEKLTLRGHVTGNYLWELENLKDLHFDVYDVKLKTAHIRQLYKRVPLKKLTLFSEDHKTSYGFAKAIEPLSLSHTLEELRVAGDVIHMTISKIKKIKSLRKITAGALLSFRSVPYPLEDIGTYFGTEVESIVFNNVVRDRAEYLKGLNRMTNLRKLVFYNDSVTSKQLRSISIELSKTLEEFYYIECTCRLNDVEKFVFVIVNCTKLKILDVSGSFVDLTLINRIANLLNKQERLQTLILRCSNTNINTSDVQNLRLPNNLKISFNQHSIELPEEYFFQANLKKDTF